MFCWISRSRTMRSFASKAMLKYIFKIMLLLSNYHFSFLLPYLVISLENFVNLYKFWSFFLLFLIVDARNYFICRTNTFMLWVRIAKIWTHYLKKAISIIKVLPTLINIFCNKFYHEKVNLGVVMLVFFHCRKTLFYECCLSAHTVIRFVWVSAKFGTIVSVNVTLVEAKMCTFTLASTTHFIFNRCPIYTHDCASAKFSTISHETDYSARLRLYVHLCYIFCLCGVRAQGLYRRSIKYLFNFPTSWISWQKQPRTPSSYMQQNILAFYSSLFFLFCEILRL